MTLVTIRGTGSVTGVTGEELSRRADLKCNLEGKQWHM